MGGGGGVKRPARHQAFDCSTLWLKISDKSTEVRNILLAGIIIKSNF